MWLPRVLSLLVFVVSHVRTALAQDAVWMWTCQEGLCIKERITPDVNGTALSLPACRLFCLTAAGIWPLPTGKVTISHEPLVQINVNDVEVRIPGVVRKNENDLFTAAIERFKGILGNYGTPQARSGGRSLVIELKVSDKGAADQLTLETSETYTLTIARTDNDHVTATITADNFFGARHGLESLSQVIIFDDIAGQIKLPFALSITDNPHYPYRGILLDTARNYMEIAAIRRTLEAMGASKLNRLHWHITDAQSFPFVSNSNPQLARLGAYSRTQVYKPSDIAKLVFYAAVRGVRIVPEFDAPAHVGEGWQETGFLVCFNAKPWEMHCSGPPCGQFDPTQPKLYDALEGLYGDMVQAFKPDIFHMGGDEVLLGCWRSSKNITNWMSTEKNWKHTEEGFTQLWNHFQSHALARLDKVSGNHLQVVIWTNHLTAEKLPEIFLSTRYIIQVWNICQSRHLLEKGYKVILSNVDDLYLDCGYPSWNDGGRNHCSPYKGWQNIYTSSPLEAGDKYRGQILGSEAPLWSEQVDGASVDGRFWPRAAALAERLWTEPKTSWREAEQRMLAHRERIKSLGIAAEALQPKWCHQNQGSCSGNRHQIIADNDDSSDDGNHDYRRINLSERIDTNIHVKLETEM